jgi:DNA-binding transcriptional LysR family regulator
MAAPLCEKIVVNDPSAMRESALLVLGVALLAVPDVLPAREEGALLRLVPRWYSDVGAISIYFASRSLLPAKPALLSTRGNIQGPTTARTLFGRLVMSRRLG